MSPHQLNPCNCSVQLPFIIERRVGSLALGQWLVKHQGKNGLVVLETNMMEMVVIGIGMIGTAHTPCIVHQVTT
eukprot:853677-Ditylum_brightwellii.AAC.1